MHPIELIHIAINGLALLLKNPALGGSSNLRLQEASELLGLLDQILTRGEEAYEDLVAFAETIQAMVDANRAPTPAEWAALRARSDTAHAVLQEAKAALDSPEGTGEVEPNPGEPVPSTGTDKPPVEGGTEDSTEEPQE